MTNPLDGNGVAAAEMAFTGDPRPGLPPGMRSSLEAAIVAYLVTASSSEERKRRAAGPSSVKWPMPDPLAKHRAPAPSQTAVEPVALAQALKNLTEGAEQEDREILYAAASTLTAQAAALVAAEARANAAYNEGYRARDAVVDACRARAEGGEAE